jgi:hypothetical protein
MDDVVQPRYFLHLNTLGWCRGRSMNLKFLAELGKFAGVGGIALGVVAVVLKDVLANSVFQALPPERAYQLLLIIIIGLFVLGLLGILAWMIASRAGKSEGTQVRAEGGSAAFGNNAKGNTFTINNAPSGTKVSARQEGDSR